MNVKWKVKAEAKGEMRKVRSLLNLDLDLSLLRLLWSRLRGPRDWLRHWPVPVPLSDGDSHQSEGWQSPPAALAGIPSVRLSVAPSAVRVVRLAQWALCGIMVIACTLSGWWWWDSRGLEEEAAHYALAATRTEELNRQFTAQMQRDQLTLLPQQIAAIRQDVAFINQLAVKRSFSWTQLLSDLEEALPPATSIGKIQLNMKESLVTFEGLAVRMQDVNALIASLQTHPAFSVPVLHHHKLVEAQKAHDRQVDGEAGERSAPVGVEFSLTVMYRPHAQTVRP